MAQEDKYLLIKDLCARLPYGVKVQVTQVPIRLSKDETLTYNRMYSLDESDEYITIKPYLRSLSSMTEEEKSEFINCAGYEVKESVNGRHYEYYLKDFVGTKEEPIANVDAIDWLNEHHFDFRNLIEKGLAIEVTEENNPYKE